MSKALECVVGADAKATATFIDMVDKLFDCLNVSNLNDGRKSKKAFREPYTTNKDFRLKVINCVRHAVYLLCPCT